jgi:hypothetical protein
MRLIKFDDEFKSLCIAYMFRCFLLPKTGINNFHPPVISHWQIYGNPLRKLKF